VEDLIKGKDGQVHAAHIRISNYTATRPVSKLYPLEAHSKGSETASEEPHQSIDRHSEKAATTDLTVTHVRRAAATKALEKMKSGVVMFRILYYKRNNYVIVEITCMSCVVI